MKMSRIILGLTGSFGSGCSYIAEKHLVPKGFKHISLSTFLKDEFRQAKGRDALNRRELQSFGNEIRSSKGLSYLAMRAMQQIDEDNDCELWVIDSIKNEHEVYYLRSKSSAFYLFGIYADAPLRWERVKHKYKHKQDDFMEDDKRDSGEDIKEGQKVRNCFAISDIIISGVRIM
jgi:dephospho-CoA kinase